MKKVIITANNVSSINPDAVSRLNHAGFEVEEYPDAASFSSEELLSILQNSSAVIAGVENYTREILVQTPSLKLIARRGVGVDNIDMEAASALGITVTRTEGLVGSAVAELIMAYLLEHSRKLSVHNADMKNNIWHRRLSEGLNGKTLGIIGFGSIAREVAVRANVFGVKVLCYYRHRDPELENRLNVQYTDFDSLISYSDYISVNVPLNEETRNMFHKAVFMKMKNTAVIINTARSQILNTEDLIDALKTSQIGGAYIDVYDLEPYHNMILLSCDNAFFTPHIGTYTRETFQAMNSRSIDQVIKFFNP
jgi:D-3-phosphoglycerate dehydrogenase